MTRGTHDPTDHPLDRLTDEVLGRLRDGWSGPHLRYVGDYRLEQEVARGGMGVVYRARQLSLDRPVAVKMILAGRLASDEEVARFRAEAEAVAALQHPGIVAIHEVGEHEGHHYFSMDFVEGRSLAGLGDGAPVEPRRAARLVRDVADALDHAHRHGVVHRDLKPANVLLDWHDRVRVADFGLAKRTRAPHDATSDEEVMGTPRYMAPEQASGGPITPAVDVYAMGALLYELLTGAAPFAASSPVETLRRLATEDPRPPRARNPRLPTDLERVCLRALEREPARRYASAADLRDDLARFLDGAPVRARRVGPWRRALHAGERHPWTVALLAGMLATALAGLTYGLWAELQRVAWVAQHPGAPQESGAPRTSAWLGAGPAAWGMLLTTWVQVELVRRSSGLAWRRLLDRRAPGWLGAAVVPRGALVLCGLVVALTVAYGACLVPARIDDLVWRGRGGAGMAWVQLSSALAGALLWARIARHAWLGIPPWRPSEERRRRHVDLLELRVHELLEEGALDRAEEVCALLRAAHPDAPEASEMLAEVRVARGARAPAAELFRRAAEQYDHTGAHESAAILRRRAADLEHAHEAGPG